MTRKTYRIRYKDPDPASPVFSMTLDAYNAQAALDQFFNGEDDFWTVLSIKEVGRA